AARIGVIAAGNFDRRFDQETAGVVADRAERIIVGLEPLARRLTLYAAGHRGRDRHLVGAFRRRDRQAQLARQVRPGGRRRRAGTWRRFWPCLRRIILWLLPCAVERIIAGVSGPARGGQAIGRHLPDPRRRPDIAIRAPHVALGIGRRRIVDAGGA